MTTETLDAKGLTCPMPVLRAKKAIKGLQPGDILEILATDPGSVKDMAAFAKATGNELLDSTEADGVFRYRIKKGG